VAPVGTSTVKAMLAVAVSPSLTTAEYSGAVSPGPTRSSALFRSAASATRSGPEVSTVTGNDSESVAGQASSSAPSMETVTVPASPGVAPVLLTSVSGWMVSTWPASSWPMVQVIVVPASLHCSAHSGTE
jgi:hypothetical protein